MKLKPTELTAECRYHEMLFMIDTCQANTMYSKFYSPNIIATGSSEIDQSSYSHHADNDVGVAVIDRYTYYNLDFLETQVREPTSKLTLGDLFDSYDEAKIHSHPGVRYDLFNGGEEAARTRLVMDFFGNVQNVELESSQEVNETQWKVDLQQLEQLFMEVRKAHNVSPSPEQDPQDLEIPVASAQTFNMEKAMRVNDTNPWAKRVVGALALAACGAAWVAGSWMESTRKS